MMWLFGEIWLWLLIAFALGAITSWLVLRVTQRPKAEPQPYYEAEPEYEPEPEPLAAEQTQFIPAAWVQPDAERPESHRFADDEPEAEPTGHREGRLPLPPQRTPQAEDWPTEEEPAWPESEDAAPQWPHQPGRGG